MGGAAGGPAGCQRARRDCHWLHWHASCREAHWQPEASTSLSASLSANGKVRVTGTARASGKTVTVTVTPGPGLL